MDKQREEFEECDAVFWDSRPFWKAKYFSCDAMIDSTHMIQARTEFRLGWQAANQRNKELQSENETCRNLMRIKQEQNDAFSQRIEELNKRIAETVCFEQQ